jgi:hypothetical protein
MLAAMSSRCCPVVTDILARWVERASRDACEEASFSVPLLYAEIELLLTRSLCRWSRAA